MSRVVIGFDPSFTSYGVSDGERSIRIETFAPDSTMSRAEYIFGELTSFVEDVASGNELVFAIEGPSIGSAMAGALWDAGYLMAHYDAFVRTWSARSLIVPPASLKKFVTGKGNTPKAEMALRVWKKWKVEFADDRGGDKLHAYCLHRYGLAVAQGEVEHAEPKPRGQGKDRRAGTRAAARTRATV